VTVRSNKGQPFKWAEMTKELVREYIQRSSGSVNCHIELLRTSSKRLSAEI